MTQILSETFSSDTGGFPSASSRVARVASAGQGGTIGYLSGTYGSFYLYLMDLSPVVYRQLTRSVEGTPDDPYQHDGNDIDVLNGTLTYPTADVSLNAVTSPVGTDGFNIYDVNVDRLDGCEVTETGLTVVTYPVTIGFFLKVGDVNFTGSGTVFKIRNSDDTNSITFDIDEGLLVVTINSTAPTADIVLTSTTNFENDSEFHFVTLESENGNHKLYINGVEEDSSADASAISSFDRYVAGNTGADPGVHICHIFVLGDIELIVYEDIMDLINDNNNHFAEFSANSSHMTVATFYINVDDSGAPATEPAYANYYDFYRDTGFVGLFNDSDGGYINKSYGAIAYDVISETQVKLLSCRLGDYPGESFDAYYGQTVTVNRGEWQKITIRTDMHTLTYDVSVNDVVLDSGIPCANRETDTISRICYAYRYQSAASLDIFIDSVVVEGIDGNVEGPIIADDPESVVNTEHVHKDKKVNVNKALHQKDLGVNLGALKNGKPIVSLLGNTLDYGPDNLGSVIKVGLN